MSKKVAKPISGVPSTDPTMPKVSVNLSGKEYHLVFTFAALTVAEQEFRKMGKPINIFSAFDSDNLSAENTTALLYAAIITAHPDTDLSDVPQLITMRDIPAIRTALVEAFNASMAVPEEDTKTGPLEQV